MSLKTIGTPKNGYDTHDIIEVLGLIIEGEGGQRVVIVGVGHLGSAIVSYLDGMRPDLRIVAAFETDPAKIGKTQDYVPCLPLSELANVVRNEAVLIGIVAVPSAAAQEIATQLVNAGVRALLNFTSIKLKTPVGVFVEDVDISIALEKSAYFARTLAAAAKSPLPTGAGQKILCIDSDKDGSKSHHAILNDSGYEVLSTFDVDEGVQLAKINKPALIIFDTMTRDTPECCRVAKMLREESALQWTPILMLTANSNNSMTSFDKIRDGEALPVDAFIDKPVAPLTLLSAIRRLLGLTKDQINVDGDIATPCLLSLNAASSSERLVTTYGL